MTTRDDPFDGWSDLVEAARELQIHPQSLRRLIKQGRVPATMFGGKYMIERDKLDMFKTNYDRRPGRKRSARLMLAPASSPAPQPPTRPSFGQWFDIVEAARELQIHPQSLRRLIKQGPHRHPLLRRQVPDRPRSARDVQNQLRPPPGRQTLRPPDLAPHKWLPPQGSCRRLRGRPHATYDKRGWESPPQSLRDSSPSGEHFSARYRSYVLE